MTNRYPDEQRTYVEGLYARSGNSPSTARELFRQERGCLVSISYIGKVWKDANFERNSHGGKRTGISEQDFKEIHERCRGNLELISQETRLTLGSLVKKCNKLNLNYKNGPKSRKRDTPFLHEPNEIVSPVFGRKIDWPIRRS